MSGSSGDAPDELLETATEHHRAGRLGEARRLYAEVLAANPANALALFRSGLLELQEGRAQEACVLIEKAVELSPDEVRFRFGQGQALQTLGRWREAADAYLQVTLRQQDSLDALLGLGIALQRAGDLVPAADAYRRALALKPDDPSALGNLGSVLCELGDHADAIRLLESAARLEPRAPSHAINLGIALAERRDFTAAETILRGAVTLAPNDADAAFNLGNALRGLGRAREALEQYRRATSLRPHFAEALNNLGNTYRELGEFANALAAFEAALAAQPRYVLALNNAGCLLRTLGRSDAAEDMLRRGLAVDAGAAALHDNLGNVLKDAGALDEAIECYRRSLALEPASAATHSNLAYALSFQSETPEPILEECRRWNARFAAPLERCAAGGALYLSPGRRLRVGYVSGDFRDHCQTLFTLPLFTNHDRDAIELHAYSSVERPDAYTERLARHADRWREVRALDDAALCRAIAADRIDVLVDLNMHMANGRPLVFARKPAPVQIAWLAYPGTTGMPAIDYRLSDPRLDPPAFDGHYVESTLRLPDSFWCYDPLTAALPITPLPALERGYVTLGCLNNPCKLTERTLDLWGEVLRALPEARLKLMAPSGRHRQRLLDRLHARGVDAERASFVEFRPRDEYLRTYQDIDLGLDTFPYSGHTTSLDAFWMGVPIVTRVGATCVGRGGLSQLHQLGLADLAAESDPVFVSIALALAHDLPRLARLRATLRATMQRSPLMDGARFARHIEQAYREAWTRFCANPLAASTARAPP
jgi:protein O-GlcNAc transferase